MKRIPFIILLFNVSQTYSGTGSILSVTLCMNSIICNLLAFMSTFESFVSNWNQDFD